MLLATGGCGEGPDAEPVRQPVVLRKQITMPMEGQTDPSKASKVKPVAVAPEIESAQEEQLSVKDAKETALERKIVKEIPPQQTGVEPALEEKKPETPSVPEALVPESRPEEKASEGKRAKVPAVAPAEMEASSKEAKPVAPSEEKLAVAPIEGIKTAPPYDYSPVGKIDPFQPLFRIKAEAEVKAKKVVKKKRLPLTPLQKISLGQLKVVGIILSPAGNKALVEDAAGKGFIVTRGTYIGQNFGQVKEILKNRIIVEEEVEDVLSGKMKPKTTELRLQKEAGDV